MNKYSDDFNGISDLEMLGILEGLAGLFSDEAQRRNWRELALSLEETGVRAGKMISDMRTASRNTNVGRLMEAV